MKFGVFDHVDSSGLPLAEHYAARMRIVQAYERCGIHGYHVAEHHSTPLGYATSPSVYLAAVAQHTSRIRIGSLIYILPLYHPLRLVEEICMLDHLSNGRLMMGIGRGASPIEAGFYGIPGEEAQQRYFETSDLIMQALQTDVLSFNGKYHQYKDVPMTMRPLQQPHPELWYASRAPDSFAWAARAGANTVTLAIDDQVRQLTDIFKATWLAEGNPIETLPLVGASRHIVVADTDAKAKDLAARAYDKWLSSFRKLWMENGYGKPLTDLYLDTWQEMEAIRNGCAGSPETVLEYTRQEVERCGVNYLVSWFAFGDLPEADVVRSVELFAEHVMPAFA